MKISQTCTFLHMASKHLLFAAGTLAAALICSSPVYAGRPVMIANDNGAPVAAANVTINLLDQASSIDLVSDVNGNIDLTNVPEVPVNVKVKAPSHIPTEFKNIILQEQKSLQINRADKSTSLEVAGETTQFPNLKKDGKVDFALVFPALTRRQLAQFAVTDMISPETDQIKIATEKADIPSNLTLPNQKESYIIPITFDKAKYRMYLKQPGHYRMTAIHGQFPLKQVISDLNGGKSFFEVINHFRFIGAGQKDVYLNDNLASQDMVVNQIPLDATIAVTGPKLPADHEMISVSLVNQAGLYFPTDVKRISSGETRELSIPSGSSQNLVVNLLMNSSVIDGLGLPEEIGPEPVLLSREAQQFLRQLKIALNPVAATRAGEQGVSVALIEEAKNQPIFLPLIAPPVYNATSLTMAPPATNTEIEALATYVVLSQVTPAPEGTYGADKTIRLQESFVPGWVDSLMVNTPANLDPKKSYRWEVMYLGRSVHSEKNKEYFLNEVTHVTRNYVNF